MEIKELKLGQKVKISKKEYTYEGIKKVPGKIGKVQKIVFQGIKKEDQVLYGLNESMKTLEDENIDIVWPS